MIPRARTYVHGVGGHAERVGARARFAARRAGRWSLGFGKVVLWLVVVTSSLLAIVLLAARGGPTYRDASAQRERASRARLELSRRAIEIEPIHERTP